MAELTNSQRAFKELNSLYKPADALLYLEALNERRRKQTYVSYWEPYPEQFAIFRKFSSDIKVFGLVGGNRSGKTISGSAIAVAWALGKDYFRDEPAWEWVKDLPIPEPPTTIWVVGLDFAVVRDVIWHEKLKYVVRPNRRFCPKLRELLQNLQTPTSKFTLLTDRLLLARSALTLVEKNSKELR